MYYIAEATFKDPCPVSPEEMAKLHAAHVAYVNEGIDLGLVLLAGPKAAGKGGFIIMQGDEEAVSARMEGDPLVTSGVQSFRLTAWNIYDKAEALKELF